MSDQEFPEDSELNQAFLDIALDDLRERAEDWCLVISPLPDKLGWRAEFMIGGGSISAGVAGDVVATKAGLTALGRGIEAIDEAIAEAMDDQGLT